MTNSITLAYEKIGQGSEILFAFHGFGQDKTFFRSWEKKLGNRYTIYAIDLFYHGGSTRPIKKLTKKEWARHFEKVLLENQIKSFSLLGYSLGGRFAISSALSFPERTNELILIAPDGIFLTIWFKLATTPLIRQVFKYVVMNPDKLEKWARFNEKTRLSNTYISDFVRKEMGTPENKKRVYISWNAFKSLGYKKGKLIALFQKHSFKRRIILGSKDYVIKLNGIRPIIEKMGKFEINVLEKKHHQLLDEDVSDLLV